MPREVTLSQLVDEVKAGHNIEVVDFKGDLIVVDEVKGIVKGDVGDIGELKKRRPRGGPTGRQLELASEVARRLAENRVKFKIVYGPREVTIRFDLDRYVRVTEEDSRVVGFTRPDEEPLKYIYSQLEGYGKVKFLKPLK